MRFNIKAFVSSSLMLLPLQANGAFYPSGGRASPSLINVKNIKAPYPIISKHYVSLQPSSSSSSSSQSSESEEKKQRRTITATSSEMTTDTNAMKHRQLDMPWSEFQEWALRDNLPRYLVTISTNDDDDNDDETFSLPKSSITYALWHTMLREVPELSGYDISTVRRMHQQMTSSQSQNNNKDDDEKPPQHPPAESPLVMPLLEQFQFNPNGGITGNIHGLRGIAEGTTVTTPPLSRLEVTVPKGYVRTEDGDVVYELGLPLGETADGGDGWTKEGRMALLRTLSMTQRAVVAVGEGSGGVEDDGQLLVKLGGLTSILLAGATAVNMFHHHLTVNVFWV